MDPQQTPTVVAAEPRTQAGQEILVAPCPACQHLIGLSGEGKILCRCGKLLDFKKSAPKGPVKDK